MTLWIAVLCLAAGIPAGVRAEDETLASLDLLPALTSQVVFSCRVLAVFGNSVIDSIFEPDRRCRSAGSSRPSPSPDPVLC